MAKSRQDVVGVNCVKDANGKVSVENDQVKEECISTTYSKKYIHVFTTWQTTWVFVTLTDGDV